MAEGRKHAAWNHTAALMAWIGNCNPYRKKGTVYRTSDFHPCLKGRTVPRAEFGILRAVFVNRKRH